jgi:hypothetical protein
MYDLFHDWGGDLLVGTSGDLALATGSDVINQRIYRRLLTNPGDYLWNLDYGGGLAQFVGLPAKPTDIEAVILNQLLLETAIPATPVPQVTSTIDDATNGSVAANIVYADPTSQQSISLTVATG